MDNNEKFWILIDNLIENSKIIIDRPKGTCHPKFKDLIYEVDYGYLENTSSIDKEGIDVYLGTDDKNQVDAIICTVDLLKKDSEIKILIGCTEKEEQTIYEMHNKTENMKGILIKRNNS